MFTDQEFGIILSSHNGVLGEIGSFNYDGSLHIDVFDLYKSDKKGIYFVVEEGSAKQEGSLQECLDYIHRWL